MRLMMIIDMRVIATALLFAVVANAKAADVDVSSTDAQFFEAKVRPILVARCRECHTGAKAKSSFSVESREALLKGGDSGPAIVPGKPIESLLVEVLSYRSAIQMPPKAKLLDSEIAIVTEWVRRGAPWPNSIPATTSPTSEQDHTPRFTETQTSHWAFQPIRRANPPQVKSDTSVRTSIDAFLMAELDANSLTPVREADRQTLIRRAFLDLIGLPPTSEDVEEFLADKNPDAFERVIDRLLASPHYGERWGRHWLDVARYADSNGLDENLAYANAYRYRDYVIKSFREDKPYSQFLSEQIAGDLLGQPTASSTPELNPPDAPSRNELSPRFSVNYFDSLTATGFLSLGAKMLAEDDPIKMHMDIIDEQVDTLSRAVMGLTMGCARCHDHKFDPLTMEDYYGLAGIFKSTKTMNTFSVVAQWHERPLATPEQLKQRDEALQRIASKKQAIEKTRADAVEVLMNDARQQAGNYLMSSTREWRKAELLKSVKPRGADPKLLELDGVVLIEAEDFARGNVLKDRDGYGKGIGVLVNRGEQPNFTEYDIDLKQDGSYQFEIRYAAANSRPVKVFWDGVLIKADSAKSVTGSWTPETQTWFVEGLLDLKSGRHTLRLEQPTFFPHIDKLLLVPIQQDAITANEPAYLKNRPTDRPSSFTPIPSLVAQWTKALEVSKDNPNSILTGWHQFVRTGKLTPSDETKDNGIARLLGQKQPESLVELADRYDLLFQEAGKQNKPIIDPILATAQTLIADANGPFAVPQDIESRFANEVVTALKEGRSEIARMEAEVPKFPEVMAVSDSSPVNLKIHLRGSHLTLGREVPHQFPRIFSKSITERLGQGSNRLQLAQWLTGGEHPLTSRVMVNRIWLGHFGHGLVRSPDNFGLLGERASHPVLLDWLADEFVRQRWSIKSIHRLMMSTSAYRRSTSYDGTSARIDPENRFLWRFHRRRMEVESLRDSLLFVSGQLDESPGGSLLPTPNRAYVTSTANVNPQIYSSRRRSVYLPVVRSALYEVFTAFDFADPSTLNGQRDQTTVAPQALFMMNSELMLSQCRSLAEQLLSVPHHSTSDRVVILYQRAYSRRPGTPELERAIAYLERLRATLEQQGIASNEVESKAWTSLCRAVLSANEFVYVD